MLSRKIILSAVVAAFALAPSVASAASNLIINGDFSQASPFPTGFSTGYNYVAPLANSMQPEGTITIAADPNSVHDSWIHVGGTNPMLIANGAANSTLNIWESSAINVLAGGKYNFAGDVMNVCCNLSFTGENSKSTINFEISLNGGAWNPLASHTTAPGMPGDAGLFVGVTGMYTAGAAGTVQIRAINAIDAASGNDFALDNLSFASAVPEPGTWAMLFLGFGAIGLMMRRRSPRGLTLAA